MRPTPPALSSRVPRRWPAPLLLALAVATGYAEEAVRIPGLNLPVATSELPQAAEVQAQAEPEPLPAPAPTERKTAVRPAAAELPAVPARVVAKPAAPVPVETRQEVLVSPGANTLIPVSKNQINRLVTPFERPMIQTVSGADITASGSVIYVTPHTDQPVTMFVTPEDDESIALSLTLLPQTVPPIQANLILAQNGPGGRQVRVGAVGAGKSDEEQAGKWERSQPYMDALRAILREMALGTLPPGYSLGPLPSGAAIPACAQPGLKFDFGRSQLITGHDFRIYVALAQNVSNRTLEFDHGACTHPYRAAVSSWPHEILEPGQKTEVFLVTRVPTGLPDRSSRPSLLQ